MAARGERSVQPSGHWLDQHAPPRPRRCHRGFVDGLRDAGLVEDRDFIIDYRSSDEQYDRLLGLAAELVQRRVSVLAAPGGMALAAAARDATSTIRSYS